MAKIPLAIETLTAMFCWVINLQKACSEHSKTVSYLYGLQRTLASTGNNSLA